MDLQLETNRHGHLIIRQRGGSLLRQLIGLPLLGFGFVLAYGAISSPIITLQEQGSSGLGNAVVGSLVLLIFAAIVLPMGWWIVLSRHWIELDNELGEIRCVSDWRIGRSQKHTPLDHFKSVRLAVEELQTASNSRRSSHTVWIQMIRLIARDPSTHPSIEIGWMDKSQRAKADSLAEKIAAHLHLPLQAVDGDMPALSPSEEQLEKEHLEEDR